MHSIDFTVGFLLESQPFSRAYLEEPDFLDQSHRLDGLEEPLDSDRHDLRRVLAHVEADPHIGLRGQVVDLIRLDGAEDLDQSVAVNEVTVVERDLGRALLVGVGAEMADAGQGEGGRGTDDPVNLYIANVNDSVIKIVGFFQRVKNDP